MKKYQLLAYYKNVIFDYENLNETMVLYDEFLKNVKDLALKYNIIIDICQAGSDNKKDMYFDACIQAKNKKNVLEWLKSFNLIFISSDIQER